ncbi:MAG TPA: flavodoxin domain-containing protein [Herpetosiphonaceae bacterium]
MNTPILIAYATRYGSTQEVAEVIAATLRQQGLVADLQPMGSVQTLDGYGAVVLGAALYMFHWPKDALRFLSRHRAALTERPVAVFALGPVHDPHDEQEWQASRAQLDQELARFPWLTPIAVALFGGTFDPAKLRFPMNWLAGKAPASDARDWTAIRSWAHDLAAALAPALQETQAQR